MEKDLDGNSHDIAELISWYLPGGTEDHPPKKERKKKTWCSG
jgi:hypothetical protein